MSAPGVQIILQIVRRDVGGATLTLQQPASVDALDPYDPYDPYGVETLCRELLVQWRNRHPLLITAPEELPLSANQFDLYPFWRAPRSHGRGDTHPVCQVCVTPLRDAWEVQLLTGLMTFAATTGRATFRYGLTGGSWSGWTAPPSHAVPGFPDSDTGAVTVTQRIQQILSGAIVAHRAILLPHETGYRVAFATAVTYLDPRPPLRLQLAGDLASFP